MCLGSLSGKTSPQAKRHQPSLLITFFLPSFFTLMFDPHFWPSFLTLIFDPHFWPSFSTLIFYPYCWPSFFTHIFDNLKDGTGDLTFETLITILTIENLNSDIHSYLTINCDTGQHSQFLRCFLCRGAQGRNTPEGWKWGGCRWKLTSYF